MSLERLIKLVSVKSVDPSRVFEGSPSTSPETFGRADALAAMAIALSSSRPAAERVAVIAAMIRDCPGELTLSHAKELRQAVNRELFVRFGTLPPKDRPGLMMLDKISHAAIAEHADPMVCRHCNGVGWVRELRRDGSGVHLETCSKCHGIGRRDWSIRRRSESVGKHCRYLEKNKGAHALYIDALAVLSGMRSYGLTLIRRGT